MTQWKLLIPILAVCVAAAGCRAFQPTPKPLSGGALIATIPPVAPPAPVELNPAWTNAPAVIEVRAPENSSIPTTSTWTRKTVDGGGWSESLTTSIGNNQQDKARDAWGSLEKFKAQLKTYGTLRWAGIFLIVVGCAGFVPQVRLIMGRSGQTACFFAGFGLVFGAQMFQGNETLAMVLTFIGIAVWVLARRYGILQGAVLKGEGKI